MTRVVVPKTVEDRIADIFRRIRRLETGGRPQVGIANFAESGALVLSAGEDVQLESTLSWSNSDVQTVMGAIPYLSIYVDNDGNDAYLWPSGVSLSAGQKDLEVVSFMDERFLYNNANKAKYRIHLKNRDSGSHTYYIRVNYTYMTGGTGSE